MCLFFIGALYQFREVTFYLSLWEISSSMGIEFYKSCWNDNMLGFFFFFFQTDDSGELYFELECIQPYIPGISHIESLCINFDLVCYYFDEDFISVFTRDIGFSFYCNDIALFWYQDKVGLRKWVGECHVFRLNVCRIYYLLLEMFARIHQWNHLSLEVCVWVCVNVFNQQLMSLPKNNYYSDF